MAVPAVLALAHRAWSRKTLTPLGIIAAVLTAIAHVVHPWSAPFALLAVFYLGGSKVTKVKHEVKARLTLSATGAEGGEAQRTHIQVLANSVVATVLVLLHTWVLARGAKEEEECFSLGRRPGDVLVVGFVANYAAVAADTFSSELGILSKSKPRLVTSPTLRVVPPGTNGGVTATGLLAGVLGAFTIAVTSAILIPFCSGEASGPVSRVQWVLAVTVWGALGSVLDSILGGLLQASVVDKRSGKIVEGTGGGKVLVHPSSARPGSTAPVSSFSHSTDGSVHLRHTEEVANAAALKGTRATGTSRGKSPGRATEPHNESRRVESGWDVLDNNAVNVLMAFMMSVGGMLVACWAWNFSFSDVGRSIGVF
ncbi:transmembrane protein 19 [Aspergillus lentulus]|uniref:Transmembrane protein 19 n=1 Tax=Aspergillus lentulus TaxID=293939 RepID=A0AAN4PGQ5_ASPLE|nr:transmembrane protein 19 [Aspergillus lentulus]